MWSEIDGDVLTVPASRMKMGRVYAVPLVPAVVALLDTLPRFGPHLLSLTGARPFNSWADLKTKIDRLMPPDTPPFVFHDLRRSARTHLSSLTSPDIAERVLAHAVGGIRGVYDKASYLDAKRLALERWSERLRTINFLKSHDHP